MWFDNIIAFMNIYLTFILLSQVKVSAGSSTNPINDDDNMETIPPSHRSVYKEMVLFYIIILHSPFGNVDELKLSLFQKSRCYFM